MRISITRRRLLKSFAASPLLKWANWPAQRLLADSLSQAEAAPAPFERRIPISLAEVSGQRTDHGDLFLKPGATLSFRVPAPTGLNDTAWRLRLIGEVDIDRQLRSEDGFPTLYRLIDDALDRTETDSHTYSLRLCSSGEQFPRRAYFRVLGDSGGSAQESILKIWAKKAGVKVSPGGRVGVEVAVYHQRPGRNRADISGPPDATYFLTVGEGTADWEQFHLPIPVDDRVACLLFAVVGEKFSGNVWVEDPQFPAADGQNALPPFAPVRAFPPYRNWLGENLSEKEWPKFRLTLNQRQIFHGALFQPEYSWPANEVDIPPAQLRPGWNDLEIQLLTDCFDPLGYVLHGLEWLGTADGKLEVVACPSLVDADKEFSILVSTREPGLTSQVSIEPDSPTSSGNIIPTSAELFFAQPGLHFVNFRTGSAGAGGIVKFRFGTEERRASVKRVVERAEDAVLMGSGDSLYVPQEAGAFRRFFAWYLHHSVGNSIGFRPIYRWGGTRTRDPQGWQEAVRLCEGAKLKYANIIDGRELPGVDGNPTDAMLAGSLYMGSQTHEQDGMFDYWGIRYRWPTEELFWDIYLRCPDHARAWFSVDPRISGAGPMTPLFYDPAAAQDMREGAEYFIKNVQGTRHLGARHSGPSTLFKYFFQAGYEWLAAELMYGPHEVVLGALRGASLAYGQPRYGVHLAAEWSTTPHDDPAAFRRYFLALATCYMQGVEHIHLEEGLWHMEEGASADDRFSAACLGHLKVHQDMYTFVRAHTRRGRLRVPVGFLQGKHDSWTCFQRKTVWGQRGPEWRFGNPEESWDLLKVFMPRSQLDAIYREPCPHQPVGFFTGTPYGPVDVVPMEASAESLAKYRSLVMLGWNTADAAQVEALLKYVTDGGQLLLGLPHLSVGTRRSEAPKLLDTPDVHRLIGAKIIGLTESSGMFRHTHEADEAPAAKVRGGKLTLGKLEIDGAEPRVIDENGVPLLLEHHIGRGCVRFVNASVYPAHPSLAPFYAELVRQVGDQTLLMEKDKVWVRGSEDASFAVYDWQQDAGNSPACTIYLLNINWWDEKPRPAEAQLLWKTAEIPLQISHGKLQAITLCDDWGIRTEDFETDVMRIEAAHQSARITIQGSGNTKLSILHRGSQSMPVQTTLHARSRKGDLNLVPTATRSVWQTQVDLHGPDLIEIDIRG
jgi:hypothetical protein